MAMDLLIEIHFDKHELIVVNLKELNYKLNPENL